MKTHERHSSQSGGLSAFDRACRLPYGLIKGLRLFCIAISAFLLLWLSSHATQLVYHASGQTRRLQAQVEYSLRSRYTVGSMVVVQVTDAALGATPVRGTVRITSASAGYDSKAQAMTLASGGGSLYYHWSTSGLKVATDYQIAATVEDQSGSWSDRIQLALSPPRTELIRELASVTDLRLPFKDVGLHLTRHYHYNSTYGLYKGSLGYGWTQEFGSVLTESTDGYISLFEGTGSGRYYQSNGDNTYQSPLGDYSKLTRNPDGSFTLRPASGDTWRFRSDLQLDFYQDRNGNHVSCGYDAQSHLTSLSDDSGQEIRFVNDAQGRMISATDSTGRSVHYEYDQAGNLQRVTDPTGSATVYHYDNQHRLIAIDFPEGRHRFYSYDEDGRLSGIAADGNADSLTLTYDGATGEQTITDALGRTIVARINEAGLVTDWRNGLGNTIKLQYNNQFSLTRYTDRRGNVWEVVPDSRGNPSRISSPEGDNIALTYSTDFNQITRLTDANDNRTQFDYDDKGNLTRTLYPDSSSELNVISDTSGSRTVQKRRRDGQTITDIYNRQGLLETRILADGSRNSYGYDARGNLTSASNNWGTITFEYDLLNRRTKATYPGERSFLYEYNLLSNRKRMIDPDGRVLEYTYDTAGRLIRISNPSEGAIAEYSYNLDGQPIKRTLANGISTEYEYDAAAQLTAVINRHSSGAIISSWRYEYDASGNRSKKTGPEGEETYTYDKTSQLVEVNYTDASTEAYQYDPAGNRAVVTKADGAAKWKRNALNQYTKANGAKYNYDLNGNLAKKKKNGNATYEYDAEGHLTSAQLQGSEAVSYAYNAFGRLASRTDSRGTVNFLWDGDQMAIEEGSTHTTLARYTWGRTLDEALSMRRADKDYFYLQDALLSVTELTDGAGNVVEPYRYRAFGEPASASRVANPFLFTGAFYDSQTALYNMRARWYSPALGRFLQPDPIGISGGVNLYSYVFNNPVTYADPFGLDFEDPFPDMAHSIIEIGARMGEEANRFGEKQGPPDIGGGGRGGGGLCPTFIQLPVDAQASKPDQDKPQPLPERLAARIDVPIDHALLRSDIPIFGVAGGSQFKAYRVEYGEGKSPAKWHLIASSTTPQINNEVGMAEMYRMQGDIDIRGNLATWNTGLKEWVHLPWHAPDDPTDFNGTYTIRLVVAGKDGKTVEDRVTCEVGRVIAQCLPGMAISTDKKVTLDFPQQAIQSAFRVYTIKPLTAKVPPIPKDQSLVGAIYTIREPGDRFMKPVALRFDVGQKSAAPRLQQLGIFGFNAGKGDWELLPTIEAGQPGRLETTIYGLPEKAAYFAVFESKTHQQQCAARGQTAPAVAALTTKAQGAENQPLLVSDTFENDTGEWQARDREFGATVSRDQTARADGSYCLKLTNDHFGGNFACTVRSTAFRADHYSLVSFDYRIAPGVKTDFYVRAGQTWYNIGFTDDENDFKYKDVGISRIGKIDGVIADNQWHSAGFDLDRLLAQKTGRRLVEEIIMADWDVTGYMKLDFGRNARGATLYLDNFKIHRATGEAFAADRRRQDLLVDDFAHGRATNSLDGAFGIFASPGTNNCRLDFVATAAADHALSLKYDVTARDAYAGLWSQLEGVSLAGFDQFSLRLRIVSGPGRFKVGLKNHQGVEVSLPADGYLEPADDLGWQRLVIPLMAFKELTDLSAMATFSLSFTEANHSGKGEVIVDDIKFQAGLEEIPITDFEEEVAGQNRLRQDNWIFLRGAAALAANLDAVRASQPNGHCLRISYGGDIGLDLGNGDFSYAAWATGLGGVDATGAGFVKLSIKGQKGAERLNLYLDDGTTRKGVALDRYVSVTTQWQDAFIPLRDFVRLGVDLTHLEGLQLVFEWQPMSGTLYVDDLWLSKERLPARSSAMRSTYTAMGGKDARARK